MLSNEGNKVEELEKQLEVIKAHGIDPEKMLGVMENIMNNDLMNKNYKTTDDKEIEAYRIINNYYVAVISLAEDKKAGKDNETKIILKLSIMFWAAAMGLEKLGWKKDAIDLVLGLTDALNGEADNK